jgi:hypothetical protein
MIDLHNVDVFFVLDGGLRWRFGFGVAFGLTAAARQEPSQSEDRYRT